MSCEEHPSQGVVGNIGKRKPRRHALGPQALDLPDVADSADQSLVEQRIADLA